MWSAEPSAEPSVPHEQLASIQSSTQSLNIDEGPTSSSGQQLPRTAAQMAEQLGDKSFSALLLDQEDLLVDAGLAQQTDLSARPRGVGEFADVILPPSSRPQQVGAARSHAYPVVDTQFETQSMKLDRLMAQLAESQRPRCRRVTNPALSLAAMHSTSPHTP